MEIYSRKKSTVVKVISPDTMAVESEWIDSVHEIRVILIASSKDWVITEAKGEFLRYPWNACIQTPLLLSNLVGMNLKQGGVRRKVDKTIGGAEGCIHLAEATLEAVQALWQGLSRYEYRDLTPEQTWVAYAEKLKGTCLAFKSNGELPSPQGDLETVTAQAWKR